jgi:hypothetical protein
MSDENDKKKSNVVDLSARREKNKSDIKPDVDPEVEAVMLLSDDIDDILNEYLGAGMQPDMVGAVVANRLGVLLAAMKQAGIEDPVELYLDIVYREANGIHEDEEKP